jgi:hypothetical protein
VNTPSVGSWVCTAELLRKYGRLRNLYVAETYMFFVCAAERRLEKRTVRYVSDDSDVIICSKYVVSTANIRWFLLSEKSYANKLIKKDKFEKTGSK